MILGTSFYRGCRWISMGAPHDIGQLILRRPRDAPLMRVITGRH